jgi:hypothetical protein
MHTHHTPLDIHPQGSHAKNPLELSGRPKDRRVDLLRPRLRQTHVRCACGARHDTELVSPLWPHDFEWSGRCGHVGQATEGEQCTHCRPKPNLSDGGGRQQMRETTHL